MLAISLHKTDVFSGKYILPVYPFIDMWFLLGAENISSFFFLLNSLRVHYLFTVFIFFYNKIEACDTGY